jgi:hypothetical protein
MTLGPLNLLLKLIKQQPAKMEQNAFQLQFFSRSLPPLNHAILIAIYKVVSSALTMRDYRHNARVCWIFVGRKELNFNPTNLQKDQLKII